VVRELKKRGHDVVVYSPCGGELEKELSAVKSLYGVEAPDIIIAQHAVCARDLYDAFPNTPIIFSAHGLLPHVEEPPANIPFAEYLAINERVRDFIVAAGAPLDKITIVRNMVDREEFYPRTPIRETQPRVLFISNHKKWKNYGRLFRACRTLGYPFKAIGAPYGRSRTVADEINNADIVVSWGRGILEGMSCGRCVMSYDKLRGDGYLDDEGYFFSREHNFGMPKTGDGCRYDFTEEMIVRELRRYNPYDIRLHLENIDLYHDVVKATDRILSIAHNVLAAHKA
jgi:hypothetical protein